MPERTGSSFKERLRKFGQIIYGNPAKSTESAVEKYEATFGDKSALALTSSDLTQRGLVVPPMMRIDPELRVVDLMSDPELVNYLNDVQSQITSHEANDDGEYSSRILETAKRNLTMTIDFLTSIDRLPEGFTDTQVS